MARAKKEVKAGQVSIADMRKMLNKKHGQSVAWDLTGDNNPTEVKEWIPTGSRWLDSIISRGKRAGIPVGKITEIAGLEATGKSYMAAQIAANAQRQGIGVVYFDAESAIDPEFLAAAGCDLENVLYIQAQSVEFVLETMEDLLASASEKLLFIWDSLALTPSITDVEGDFNPLSSMAVKPRILSKGMSKLVQPIANAKATLLVLNQLKTNITNNMAEKLTTPYFTPGGKAMSYSYSLRIWLTGRKAKASFIVDDKGYRIGSEVKVKLEKSRFGTAGRQCGFKILWGDEVGVQDEESWFEAIKSSEHLVNVGNQFKLLFKDGSEKKFYAKNWMAELQDEAFRIRVMEVMDEEIITKFKNRDGDADVFYALEDERAEEEKKSLS